jgi:AraC-like DNA-binding protein
MRKRRRDRLGPRPERPGEFRAGSPSADTDSPDWVRVARERVDRQFRSRLRRDQLAAEAGVHPDHLGRSFRRVVGKSLTGYLRERRIAWAATALAETADPISAIALGAGFFDQSHFTHAFVAETGSTPGEYRRRIRQSGFQGRSSQLRGRSDADQRSAVPAVSRRTASAERPVRR